MKKKPLLIVVFALLAVLIALIIFPTPIDTALVDQQMKSFAAQLQTYGNRNGKDIVFRYDGVSVEGFFLSRRVIIHRPVIESVEGADRFVFIAPELKILPQKADLTAFRLEMPSPITIARNTANIGNIILSEPVRADITRATTLGLAQDTMITLPKEWHIAPVETNLDQAQVTFKKPMTLFTSIDDQGRLRMAEVKAAGMLAQGPAKPDRYGFKNLSIRFEYQEAEKIRKRIYDIVAEQVELPIHVHPYGPSNIIVRAEVSGDIPQDLTSYVPFFGKRVTLDLHEASWNFEQFGVLFTGQLNTQLVDMPIGAIRMHLRNPKVVVHEIAVHNHLGAEGEPRLKKLFEKMSGAKLESPTMQVDIKRADNGEVMFGAASMDELIKSGLLSKPRPEEDFSR